MQLRNLLGLIAAENIDFADLCLFLCAGIIHQIIRLEHAGADFDQTVPADKRIDDCFEDKGTLWLGKIKVGMEDLVGLHVDAGHLSGIGARHVLHDVVEQCVNTLAFDTGSASHRNDRTVLNIGADCRTDFCLRKRLAGEVTVHEFLRCLGDRLHQRIAVLREIILQIVRYRAFICFLSFIAEALLLDDIDISDKLAVLPDRQIERRDFLAIVCDQILDHLMIGHVVDIHIRDPEHSGDIEFLAQIPGLLCSYLHAVLPGDHDHGGVRHTQGLLHLSDEVKISGSVENIDFVFIPLERKDRCIDGNSPLLFQLVKIRDGVAVCDLPHSGCDTRQITHCFGESGFSCTAVAEQDNVSDLVCGVNLHVVVLQ